MNDSTKGCAVVLGILYVLACIIAACPILAGITAGLFFYFVIIPAAVWIILRMLGLK
jgi:hypothetical protein